LEDYAKNPTNDNKKTARDKAIDEIASLLSKGYMFSKSLMQRLWTIIGDIELNNQNILALRKQDPALARLGYETVSPEVERTYTPSTGSGSSGRGTPQTPPAPQAPTSTTGERDGTSVGRH